MSPSRKSARGRSFGLRFLARLIGWSFSAAIALIVVTYLALPALLRYGLPHALARYGVVSSVEGARVSLTNERITLVGFQVGQAGGPAIRWGEVTARVDMAELLKGNIRIIDFQVKDARVDLAQLQASKWTPPERAAAIPELRKLNINIGDVVLRDLEFIGLSEQIGQKVALRSLSVGSLSHLEAGAGVAFQLQGVVGDGSLRLAGRARMVENLPVFEGRYELAALDLKGFGHLFGLATPRSVGGTVDGNGTFGFEYVQGKGVVRADLSGRAGVDGLELDSGETNVTRTTAAWEGDADIFWPVGGGPPRFVARGSVTSPALEAARRTTAGPYGILVRGLRWSGELRQASEFETHGSLDGDLIRVDVSGEGKPGLELELSRFSASSRYRSGRGWYEFEAGELTAESAKLDRALDAGRQSAAAFGLFSEKVRLDSDGVRIGRLEAESAEATFIDWAEINPLRSARLISIGASGIAISADGGALIDRLESDQVGFDFGNLSVYLGQASASSVEAGADRPFGAESMFAVSLRQKTGLFETWGSNLQFSGGSVSGSGEIFSDDAAAESLSQTMAGDPLWQATGVQVSRLSLGSGRIEAGRLSTTDFAYGEFGETLVEIEQGAGVDFSIRYDSGINAGAVQLGSMRYRSGQIAVLELNGAALNNPGITFDGELSSDNIDADSARYVNADADVFLLETLNLGELSGRISTRLRVDAARAARFRHDRAAGADYDATELELSRIEYSGSGRASAAAGHMKSIHIVFSDGARLTLEDVAAAHPVREVAGKYSADSGRVRSLSYSLPGERILNLQNVDVGAIDGDDNDGHRIRSLSAASATASDPAGGELQAGVVQIDVIGLSDGAGMRADLASAGKVSLTGFDGNPPASFSSARITLKSLALEPDRRLRLGQILMDDAVLTMGLDDQGKLLLPKPPFSPDDGEAAGGFVIERLETRPPARLRFFDRSTSPPFEVEISPLDVRVANFHSSDPGRRAQFSLDGRVDEFSNLKASGEVSVESDGLNLELSGKITAFELSRLNTYAAKHAKRAVRSGRGDAAFDITVRGGKLAGTVRFVFSGVKFDRTPASATGDGKNREELSLQRAFAMLRDENGIVRLTVPLSGSLDDPKFDFSDGLVQSLVKTLRSTVMLTFKPLGLLVDVTGLSDALHGLEFKPVAFDPGEQTLSGEGLAHLDALARELKRHPGVEVRLCGRAVSADRIRIEERRSNARGSSQPEPVHGSSGAQSVDTLLQSLAERRAAAVREYLEVKKEIASERLLRCKARVESTPGRLPRVDLPVRVEQEPTAAPTEGARR